MTKVSKTTVHYIPASRRDDKERRRCENCVMYHRTRDNRGTCDLVKGVIEANAWCKRWSPKRVSER